jgi:hypothetical protein
MMKLMRDISGSIIDVYDFAGVGTVIDVGGGVGWRTIEILEAHPTMRGIPDALAILENCRNALPDDGRLVVFEPVLPEGNEPHLGKVFDLLMLVILGGRVRTEAELRRLLEAAGFRVNRVLPTGGAFAVFEACPAR